MSQSIAEFSQPVSDKNEWSSRIIHGAYQPHIDGLRAIAVLPVILFHLNESLVPGGYIGVDVFFVISGFLITGGIFRDLNAGKFSLTGFYHRRIKRIIPAYLTMVTVVLAVAMLLYSAPALKTVAKTAFSTAVFATNLRFWNNSDYFAPAAKEDPLLHMWSLGVEEQFYVFIPLLMCIFFRIGRKTFIFSLALLFLASLSLSVWQVVNESFRDAFYLPHSRAWELLAGSLIGLNIFACNRNLAKFLAPLGLVMLLWVYASYSILTPFPGSGAVIPVFATVLLIHFGTVGWVNHFLSCFPLVAIGRISYSLYLWHWPVIVFWKYLTFGVVGWVDLLGMFLVSLLLAWISWRWVELPVRKSVTWTPKKSWYVVTFGCFVVVVLSIILIVTDGAKSWLYPEANRLIVQNAVPKTFDGIKLHIDGNGPEWSEITRRQLESSTTEPPALINIGDRTVEPDFLLWGDSHAAAILAGIDSQARIAGHRGLFLNRQHGLERTRIKYYQPVIEWLADKPEINTVIFVQRWAIRFNNPDMRVFFINICKQLHDIGKRVVILRQPAEFPYNVTQYKAKAEILGVLATTPVVTVEQHQYLQRYSEDVFEILESKGYAEILPFGKVFLVGEKYIGEANGTLFYMDSNHLSPEGVSMATESIAPLLWIDAKKTQEK